MRLIDADAAVTEWYRINDIDENDRGARFVGYTEIPRWLNHIPTIDAEPVKHGKWIEERNITTDGKGYTAYRCSVCQCAVLTKLYNFCPNCGADMSRYER